MGNKSQETINKHHKRKADSKARKEARKQQRQEAFKATSQAFKLQAAYWNLAQVGLSLAILTVMAVMSIAILRYVYG